MPCNPCKPVRDIFHRKNINVYALIGKVTVIIIGLRHKRIRISQLAENKDIIRVRLMCLQS